VLVTAPVRASDRLIAGFVADSAAWVEKVLSTRQADPVSSLPRMTPVVREQARRDTRVLVAHRLAHFNQTYQLTWKRIFVRNQRRSWGSCSKVGNLNFNLRLALLAPELADYVIVHELCHRQHFNHSKEFWSLVAKTIPDYKERRRALKKYRLI
jgi:predicted metal-dependent hydrolase